MLMDHCKKLAVLCNADLEATGLLAQLLSSDLPNSNWCAKLSSRLRIMLAE
jgi:hypothetical protein